MAMNSKYNGFCQKCKHKIHIGDPIEKDEGLGKWVHVNCPNNAQAGKAFHAAKKSTGVNTLVNVMETFEAMPAEVTDEQETVPFDLSWTPSKYQQDIFDFIETGTGNGVAEAVAGSGKTSTIIKALSLVPASASVAFLAFNKHIAKEIDSRLRSIGVTHVRVSTIHSLGLQQVKKLADFNARDGIDKDKVGGIMDAFWPVSKGIGDHDKKINRIRRAIMRRAVSLAKATLVDVQDGNALMEMFERYNFTVDEHTPVVIEKLPHVMQQCLENVETIDYDDMIWLPLVHRKLKMHFEKFQYIFVDEAQDLNNSQIQFILNSAWKGQTRIICVGDRRQSLYGFRGADTEAIPRLIEMLEATVLPLSISYRCPRSHVLRAQGIVPQIEPSDTAIEGLINEELEYRDFIKMIEPGDMIICRTNAPLIKPAFEAIKAGKKAMIRGADIGAKLISFVEKFEADTLAQLEILMNEYTEKEYQRYMDKGKELQAQMVKDELDTVQTVAASCKSVFELTNKLKMLFSDSNTGVVFSSVHRAKGLEAERVFILRDDLMPHPKAKAGWEQVQESNCLYVALTRSKRELYFVHGDENDI
jgi:DNA helicase-2/ATP-dependent DNA helicase PcrA